MVKISGFLLTLALCLTACSGGDKEPRDQDEAESSQSPSATPNAADQAIAEDALLVLEDFPAGWQAQTSDDESELNKHEIAECIGVEYDELYDDSSADAESRTFISPEDVEVDHEIDIAADEAWATTAFEIASGDAFRACVAEEMEKVLIKAFEEEEGDVELGELAVNEMSFDSFGDATTALRVTIPFETQGFSLEATLDIVAVRVGRGQSVVTVSATGSGLDSDELAELVALGSERLEQSLASS